MEHDIITMVYAAKEDNQAADDLIEQYLPFIKAQTAKFTRRIPQEGYDDELSIAMFAFHEATLSYEKGKGNFLSFAATVIRNRLIDFTRKEQRHAGTISLDMPAGDEDNRTLLDSLDSGEDVVGERIERAAAREEIAAFVAELAEFDITLADVADNTPKQERTLKACHQVLTYAKEHPEMLETLIRTKKLPITQLSKGSGVNKKTLERHRNYLVATLFAYTNGFEIIRGHLRQIDPEKGGRA